MEPDFPLNFVPEGLCIGAQFILTVVSILRIYCNRQTFPVKQLGPFSTIICALCFFLASVIYLVGRIIYVNSQFTNNEKRCSCNFNQIHKNFSYSITILAIFYNLVRELPFLLFGIKILRVSICFWPKFNKIDVEKINKRVIYFIKHDECFVVASIIYVSFIGVILPFFSNENILFQFFCQKQFTFWEIIESVIRFLFLGFVYFLSIYTYENLDFTKLLLLLFIASNLSIIPHIVLASQDWQKAPSPTRDSRYPIYFMTFIIELINSCIIMYYSGSKIRLPRPAERGVLEVWRAFNNVQIGMHILKSYAAYRDGNQKSSSNKSMVLYLQQFEKIDAIHKNLTSNKEFVLSDEQLSEIQQIWKSRSQLTEKLGNVENNEYFIQYKKGGRTPDKIVEIIRRMVNILQQYCERVIFAGWKKTQSYRYLKQDFTSNGDINEKLDLFEISLT